jgi:hypothetical protein
MFSGLDLGKKRDYAALVVVQRRVENDLAHYDVRHAERWPLGTKYQKVVRQVGTRFQHKLLRWSALAVDVTGVGGAVLETITGGGLDGGERFERVEARVTAVSSTAGRAVTRDPETGGYNVPKTDLTNVLEVLFQSGRLRIDAKLKEAAALAKELENYRVTKTKAANETFAAGGSGHDDLVSALALAAWLGESRGISDIGGVVLGGSNVVDAAPPGVFN